MVRREAHVVANGEVLTLLVELGAVIAGFSGVVVALDSEPVRRWPAMRRQGLRSLLQVSAVLIAFSMLPLVLGRWLPEPGLWTWALAGYGVGHLIDVLSFLTRHTDETAAGAKIGARVGLGIAVTQIVVAFAASASVAEGVYVSVLLWHLAVAAGSFVYLLYSHDTSDASR